MVRISKETQSFISTLGGDKEKLLAPIPPSAARITPGEILIFRYFLGHGAGSRAQRTVLIVKTRRGNGLFHGKTGLLVSCFKLEGNSEAIIDAILENLYKKRRKASYYGKIKQSLIQLLGKDSFRTYKLQKMKSIWKLSLGT